jgi:NTE family protein
MLLRPWEFRLGAFVASLMPMGRASSLAQAEGFKAIFGNAWPSDALWIPALRLGEQQERVIFGHPDAPEVDVGTAVVASGAVPGVWRPIEIAGERYVDGASVSLTNLDVVQYADLDVIIVSSPLSRFRVLRPGLRRQIRRLGRMQGARGPRVVALEPNRPIIRAMGFSPMKVERGPEVASVTYRETLRALEQIPDLHSTSSPPASHTASHAD